jgi:uncharacterized protein YjiS (DUF1127 family)
MSTLTETFLGHAPGEARSASSWFERVAAQVGRSWRRARLRERLSHMSANELLDIGIAEDELDRIYRRDVFTPRAWAAQGVRLD